MSKATRGKKKSGAPKKLVEDTTSKKLVDDPTPKKTPEDTAPKQCEDDTSPKKPVENPAPEQPAADTAPKNPVENTTPKTVEQTLEFFPFAYALLDSHLDGYCWYCLCERDEIKIDLHGVRSVQKRTLQRCTSCKTAYFCSKECQRKGWIDHRAECKAYNQKKEKGSEAAAAAGTKVKKTKGKKGVKTDKPTKAPAIEDTANVAATCSPVEDGDDMDVETRMLGRLVSRYKMILEGEDNAEGFYDQRTSTRNVMDLVSHDQQMREDPEAWARFRVTYERLVKCYNPRFLLDEETVFQLHCRNYINRHALVDRSYMIEIGKGLYLDLCAYNHSCRPNALYVHHGFKAILRPLKDNVQLEDRSTTFYSYISLLMTKAERRQRLSSGWYFDCQCERCIDPEDDRLTAIACQNCTEDVIICRDGIVDREAKCSKCKVQLTSNRFDNAMAMIRHIDNVLSNKRATRLTRRENDRLIEEAQFVLSRANMYYSRLLQAALSQTPSDEIAQMLRYHLDALENMRICYPKNHPALAYHVVNIGIFYFRMDKHDTAKKFLQEALSMLRISLGDDHQMTKLALETLDRCLKP